MHDQDSNPKRLCAYELCLRQPLLQNNDGVDCNFAYVSYFEPKGYEIYLQKHMEGHKYLCGCFSKGSLWLLSSHKINIACKKNKNVVFYYSNTCSLYKFA